MSRLTLFRPEVTENQHQGLHGDVILHSNIKIKLIILLLILISITIIVILAFGHYAKTEVANGWLVPEAGIARVVADQQATISYVYEKDDTKVKRGQPLIALSYSHGLINGDAIELEQAALKKEELAIQKRISIIKAQQLLTREQLNRKVQQIEVEKMHLIQERELLSTRLDSAEKLYHSMKSSDAVSSIEVIQQKEVLLVLLQAQKRIDKERSALERILIEAQSEKALLPQVNADNLAQLQAQIAKIEQKQINTQKSGSAVVKAPIDGKIVSLPSYVGQSIKKEQLLTIILPEDSELLAELYLPTRAIGGISEGLSVRLKYEGFPYQRFGFGSGKISSISKSVLLPGEFSLPSKFDEPVYRVTVTLDSQDVTHDTKKYTLPAGMLVSAEIVQEHRPLWMWLLQSLSFK